MSMDRELSPQDRRRPKVQRALLGAFLGIALLSVIGYVSSWISPSLAGSRLRLGTVAIGSVESGVNATGDIIPAFEKVLASPVEARVLKVLRQPGAELEPGDGIVELDLATSRLDLDRLEERITQKQWDIDRRRAEFRASEGELAEQLEVARLDLEIADYRLGQQKRLFSEGLASEESQRQSEVEARKAELAVRAARRAIDSEQDQAAADQRRFGLELDILEKERDDAARRLQLATATSDRSGVLTWVVREEGAMVPRGGVLARIADLESFRVEASVSGIHASQLQPGREARVQVDDEELRGRIESVHPTIDNGVVTFLIALDEPSHPSLRNNQRVDIDVIVEQKSNVLLFPRSSFLGTGSLPDVFVLEGKRLVRRKVEIGLRGVRFVEVLSGLEVGDRVALSDLRDYEYLDEISIDGPLRE